MNDKEIHSRLVEARERLSAGIPEGMGALVILWEAEGTKVEGVSGLVDGTVSEEAGNTTRSDWAAAMALAYAMAADRRVFGIVSFALAEYAGKVEEEKKNDNLQSHGI